MIPAEKAQRSLLIWPAKRVSTVQESATDEGTLPHIGSEWLTRLALPANVWARLIVLFLALAGIKAALLVRLGKNLFEVHWRVAEHLPALGDYVWFALFVGVGFLSLMRLQSHCALAGIRAIRAANAIVLCLGLVFVFLTFHSDWSNYLFPILTALVDWDSLLPYLSLDLFFHPPFLGAWLFAYALSYYVLARTGRESWVLYLTAAFGTIYALVALRELVMSRNELLVACALGMTSLALRHNRRRTIWMVAPLVWCVLFAGEIFWFAPKSGAIGYSFTYFWLLLYASALFFIGATLIARQRGFAMCWGQLAFFFFSSFVLLSNRSYPDAATFNNTLCLGFEMPRYFAGEILLVATLALIATCYKTLFPRGSFWWMDIISLTLIAIAFVDFRLTQIMGTRLGWDVLALGGNAKMIWRMAKPYLPGVLAGIALLALLYGGVLKLVRSQIYRWAAENRNAPTSGIWYAVSAFMLLGLIGIVTASPDKARGQSGLRLVQTSPLWRRATARTMKPDEFVRTAQELGLGDLNRAGATPIAPGADLNVVLIFMESTYNKHLSLFGGTEETQPLLSKYRERMELYPNFFSTFASSIHARFATFTSLYPVRDYNAFTLQRVPVKSVFEVFQDNGYACSLFYSSFLDYTGFRSFLQGRGFDALYDADTMPGERKSEPVTWGLREQETLGAIQTQIKMYASGNQKFFLTYVPAAPHYPHEKVPEQFHKFRPGELGNCTPLYYNELLYMDWVLASIVRQLEESGLLDKTVVIITNDHGEMLGEHGGPIGHGFMLSPELVNTPLIIMDPRKKGYRVNPTIGSQVDLLPTMLDILGIPIPTEELYEGCSLARSQERPAKVIYLNSLVEYGVIIGNRIVIGNPERDKGALTRAFTFENQGSKTIFSEDTSNSRPGISFQRFDEFQENLLRNYSLYQKSLRRSPALTLTR